MKFTTIALAGGVAKLTNGFGGKGSWFLWKCFYENGTEYGEFYINLNLKTGEGEVMMKDQEYAVVLVDAFSHEMRGESSPELPAVA